jgi:hypothetical protein
MLVPAVFQHPIKRPTGFLFNARFEGNDDRLMFFVDYPTASGSPATIGFRLFDDPAPDYQEMCIPTANQNIQHIADDALIAHMRMASIISDTTPTSQEWRDAMQIAGVGQSKYFQTAVGEMRMSDSQVSGDTAVSIEFQRGTSSNKKTVLVGYSEMSKEGYSFSPSTQLLIVPGAVLKQFPNNYKHDYPGSDILTANERADIIAYVNSLQVWV